MSLRPRLAVLAVIAAGGAVSGGFYLWPSGNHVSACEPFVHAAVPTAAQKALAAYAGRIEHNVERSMDGTREESWSDQLLGRRRQVSYDESGKVTSEFASTEAGKTFRTIWVTYDAHIWQDSRLHPQFSFSPKSNPAADSAQFTRDQVANRTATVAGRGVINGRRAIRVHHVIHLPSPPVLARVPKALQTKIARTRTVSIDTWVDPVTYVTLRTTFQNGDGGSTTDVNWLPRTPANVAKTRIVIPAGFRHIVPHHSSFEHAVELTTSNSCS